MSNYKGTIMNKENDSGNYDAKCYELKLKGLSNRTTLVLSNTRELDKVPSTK